MFRNMLFSTTALAVASAAALAAPNSAANLPDGVIVASSIDGVPVAVILPSRGVKSFATQNDRVDTLEPGAMTFDNLSRDRNARFLSWYGFAVSAYRYSSSSAPHRPSSYYSVTSGYEKVAIPITGTGKAVSRIRVPEGSGKFNIALYTDDNNAPGSPITGASANASGTESGYCCNELVKVAIPATELAAGTRYWLVETGIQVRGYYNKDLAAWLAEDTDYTGDSKALAQYHRYHMANGHTYTNYTSGWESTSENVSEPAAEVY